MSAAKEGRARTYRAPRLGQLNARARVCNGIAAAVQNKTETREEFPLPGELAGFLGRRGGDYARAAALRGD